MAMAPKAQNDAATTRRYSSTPVPTSLGDRVWKAARAHSHASANNAENTGMKNREDPQGGRAVKLPQHT